MPVKNSASPTAGLSPSQDPVHHVAITRMIDAPRELVFRMWTDPKHLAQWCFLEKCPVISSAIDVRVGGRWDLDLRMADGVEIKVRRVYRTIDEPERLVFYEKCEVGGIVRLDGTQTVVLEDIDGKTRLTVTCDLASPFDAGNQQGWNWGWTELLNRLSAHLASN